MRLTTLSLTALMGASLTACGGGGGSGGGGTPTAPPVTTPPPNTAPEFTSATSFTFAENDLVQFFLTVDDADGDPITISDDTSGDGALFTVNLDSGEVIANTPDGSFDFENPLDVNGDNVYEQNITLSDGTDSTTETIRITITNFDEPPTCTVAPDIIPFDENLTGVIFTFEGEDPEKEPGSFSDVFISNTAGFDPYNDQFAFDTSTGALSVTSAFDFEELPEDLTFDVSSNFNVGADTAGCNAKFRVADVIGSVRSGIRIDGQPASFGQIQLSAPLDDVNGLGLSDHFIEKTVRIDPDIQQPGGYILYGEVLENLLVANDGATLDVSTLTAEQGIFLTKQVGATADLSVSQESLTATSLSDMDGDGVSELLVGVSQTSPETGADTPIAFLIYGSVFNDQTLTSLDLSTLSDTQGFAITIPTTPGISRNFETGFSRTDVDGDGLLDAIITQLDTNFDGHTYIVRGSGLQAQITAGTGFALSGQTPDLVVELFEAETDNFIQGGHRYITTIDDLLGDGLDEIIVSTDTGYIVITSEAVADTITNGRQSYLDLIMKDLVASTGLDSNINEPIFARSRADLDGDGLSDLVYAFEKFSGEIGGIEYGERLRSLFPGGSGSFPQTEVLEATEEFLGFPYIGAAILGDMTGDMVPEIAIADASQIFILSSAIVDPATMTLDLATLMGGDVLTIKGRFDVSGLGRGLSVIPDISGDALPDLVILDPRNTGRYSYILRSQDITEAFTNGVDEIDIATLFNNETD